MLIYGDTTHLELPLCIKDAVQLYLLDTEMHTRTHFLT